MKCDEFKNKIDLFLDNELADLDRQQFQEHLNTCETCQKELNLYRKIDGVGKRVNLDMPPDTYWKEMSAGIMNRISKKHQKASGWQNFKERFIFLIRNIEFNYRLAGLAAAAVIIFFVVKISVYDKGQFSIPEMKEKSPPEPFYQKQAMENNLRETDTESHQEKKKESVGKMGKGNVLDNQTGSGGQAINEIMINGEVEDKEMGDELNAPAPNMIIDGVLLPSVKDEKTNIAEKSGEEKESQIFAKSSVKGDIGLNIQSDSEKIADTFLFESASNEKQILHKKGRSEILEREFKAMPVTSMSEKLNSQAGIFNYIDSLTDTKEKSRLLDSLDLLYEAESVLSREVKLKKCFLYVEMAEKDKSNEAVKKALNYFQSNEKTVKMHNEYLTLKKKIDDLKRKYLK